LGNLRCDRKLADPSRLLPSNCLVVDLNLILPVGEEVAPGSAARQSAELATNAFIST